jgi:hypothetical protein
LHGSCNAACFVVDLAAMAADCIPGCLAIVFSRNGYAGDMVCVCTYACAPEHQQHSCVVTPAVCCCTLNGGLPLTCGPCRSPSTGLPAQCCWSAQKTMCCATAQCGLGCMPTGLAAQTLSWTVQCVKSSSMQSE